MVHIHKRAFLQNGELGICQDGSTWWTNFTGQVWLTGKKLLIVIKHFFEVLLHQLHHSRFRFVAIKGSAVISQPNCGRR